jgi:3-carboxy-cis,cis-muconate cycloisomerase
MLDDALERACVLTGDLLARLEVILSGLDVDPARMRANLALSGGMISSEEVMLELGRAIGRQTAHEVVYQAARADGVTFADALKRDPRVTAHLDPAAIDHLLDPARHTGLSAGIARAAAGRARATAREILLTGRSVNVLRSAPATPR